MKISNRDKKILIVLVAVVMVFCAYYFGYRSIEKKNETLSKQISINQATYNNLRDMETQVPVKQEQTALFMTQYNEIMKRYACDYSIPYIINNIINLENEVGCWVSQASLGDPTIIYKFGEITSENPYNPGSAVNATSYDGYAVQTNLSFQTSYDGFKQLIDYLNSYTYKYAIESMSCSYNSDSDIVSGSLRLTHFAIAGGDRVPNPILNKDNTGTENIFNSASFAGSADGNMQNGNYVTSDYDYYLILQNQNEELGNVIIGQKMDIMQETVISAAENKVHQVFIRFFEEDGIYYAQYRIGDTEYPAENFEAGSSFVVGNFLTMLVISEARTGSDDLSGANVTIVNDTDMVLEIKVINEDETSPRFNVKETQGEINIYY